MTEIKLALDGETNPTWLMLNLRSRAKYMGEVVGAKSTASALNDLADQVEAQIKQVDEPTAFGSVVRARSVGAERTLWVRDFDGIWHCERGAVCDSFSYFSDVEVLRVGVDGKVSFDHGYTKGTDNTRARHIDILTTLKPDLITSVEKTAIDKAIAAIQADAENTVTGPGFPS